MNWRLIAIVVGYLLMLTAYYIQFVYRPSPPKPTKKSKAIEEKIYAYLKQVAYDNSIPILLRPDDEMVHNGRRVRGLFEYHTETATGKYVKGDHNIKIRRKDYRCPYVLAHEIGHHHSITRYNDTTEEGADKELVKLFKNATTAKEWKVIEPHLKFWLKRVA